jgi:hypothetical protein
MCNGRIPKGAWPTRTATSDIPTALRSGPRYSLLYLGFSRGLHGFAAISSIAFDP